MLSSVLSPSLARSVFVELMEVNDRMFMKTLYLRFQLKAWSCRCLAIETVWGERMNQVAGSVRKKGLQLRDSGPYPTITLESSTGPAVNAKLAFD